MRSRLGLATFVFTVAPAISCGPSRSEGAAQATPMCDRLEPRPSPVSDPNYFSSPGYEATVAATLFSRISAGKAGDEELLMAMVNDTIPQPQEALYILAPPPRPTPVGQYRVVHARARSRVNQGESAVNADFSEAFLDLDAVAALERVWTGMTAAARWRRSDEILPTKVAVHGPSRQFTFDYWGNHVFSQGMTTSSEDGSCSAALVSIGKVLVRFADAPNEQERRALRGKIMGEIQKLSERLGLANDDLCGGSPCRTAALGREPSLADR